jgi:hypothetical protein
MRRLPVVMVVAAALVVVPASVSARDGDDVDVSGTYAVTDLGTSVCPPNGSTVVFRCTVTGLVSQYTGSLTGTSVANFTERINCERGRVRGHGTETFTGSLQGGGSGTLTWQIRFHSAFDCATTAVSNFSGTGLIRSGTDVFAGMRGDLDFGDVTYEGELLPAKTGHGGDDDTD